MSGEGEQRNWNELLGADNLFPEDLNNIKTDSSEAADLVNELKELLEQEGVLAQLYENYKKSFEKQDDAARTSDSVHVELFKNKLLEFAEHNTEAKAGKHSWSKGVNQFTDMTDEESSQCTGGLLAPPEDGGEAQDPPSEPPAPEAAESTEETVEAAAAPESEAAPEAEAEAESEAAPEAESEAAPEAESEAAPAAESEAAAEAEAEPASESEAAAAPEEAEAAPEPEAESAAAQE